MHMLMILTAYSILQNLSFVREIRITMVLNRPAETTACVILLFVVLQAEVNDETDAELDFSLELLLLLLLSLLLS